MARKPRIEFPGAFYHVIIRGNNRQDIFLEEHDYQQFLKRLRKYKKLYFFVLYAFVLMKNHVHMLLETTSTPLSKVMQGIDQSYTQYFNAKYRQVGHILQGRYKAILCDKDSYFLELVRYIHLNPDRAGIINSLQYPWSGHQEYMGKTKNALVDTGFLLEYFSPDKNEARRSYQSFILKGLGQGHEKRFYEVKNGQFLGEDNFVKEIEDKHKAAREDFTLQIKKEKSLEEVLTKVCENFHLPPDALIGRNRLKSISLARRVFIIQAVKDHYFPGKEVARFLQISPSTVSMALRRGGS